MKPFGCISFTFEKVFFLKSNLQNIEVADKNEALKFWQKNMSPYTFIKKGCLVKQP